MTATDAPPRPPAPTNQAAKVAWLLATIASGSLVAFATLLGWLYTGFFLGSAALFSVAAIVVGHVGHARGRRIGAGRGTALAAILVGWLALLVCAVVLLVAIGLLAGLHALTQ